MKLDRTKIYILLFLVIFIFLRFLQLYFYSQTTPDDRLIRVKILVDRYPNNCFYVVSINLSQAGLKSKEDELIGVSIPKCHQYQLGSILEVTSSVNLLTANNKTNLKVLKDPVIQPIGKSRLSLFFKLRQKILEFFQQELGSPEGEVLFSLMFGGRSNLPHNLKEQFDVLGLNHLMAVSGLHLSLVVGFTWKVLGRLKSRWLALTLVSVFILIYLALGLFRPSIVRAGMMILILFWGRYRWQRHYRSWWSLMSVFVLICLFSLDLITKISFQFSFLATLALILSGGKRGSSWLMSLEVVDRQLFLPQETKGGFLFALLRYFRGGLKLSLVVSVVLWPVVVYHFGAFSLWSLVSTSLFLWWLPVLFLLGSLLIVSWPLVSLGYLGWLILTLEGLITRLSLAPFLWGVEFLARFKQPYLTGLKLELWQVLAWYVFVSLIFTWLKLDSSRKRRWR